MCLIFIFYKKLELSQIDYIYYMLVISLCFDHHKLQHLLLDHLHKQFHLIGIDPVQIRSPPVRNRTIPVHLGLEKGNIASSFWNEGIPDPDQIGSGDGCISGCGIETGWRWSGTAEAIRNNQHNTLSILPEINEILDIYFFRFFGWHKLINKVFLL